MAQPARPEAAFICSCSPNNLISMFSHIPCLQTVLLVCTQHLLRVCPSCPCPTHYMPRKKQIGVSEFGKVGLNVTLKQFSAQMISKKLIISPTVLNLWLLQFIVLVIILTSTIHCGFSVCPGLNNIYIFSPTVTKIRSAGGNGIPQ